MSYDSWKTDDQYEPAFEKTGRRLTAEDFIEEPPEIPQCDICGSTQVTITIQGLGQFCSRAHADEGEQRFEQALNRKTG